MKKASVVNLNKKKLIVFFLLTYCITWLIWLPNLLNHFWGWHTSRWLHIMGGLGPLAGTILTTLIFDKKKGLKKYFKERIFSLPAPKWLLVGIGMPVILWHGTFNYFTTSDRISSFIPVMMSMMVIIITFWIARKYGKNLELYKSM